MKVVTIRELHEKTRLWMRRLPKLGEIHVTDRGRIIAKIVPEVEEPTVPYFARRKLTPAFHAIMGKLQGGTDSTQIISDDRDRLIQ